MLMNRRLLQWSRILLIMSLVIAATALPSSAIGPVCSSRVGNFVWLDSNQDGIQDPGEPGIAGVRVTIESLDANPPYPMKTDTNGDGEYSFEVSCGVLYSVSVDLSTLPAGYSPTVITGGGTFDIQRRVDSDSNDPNGAQVIIDQLVPGEGIFDDTIDFGFVSGPPPCSATMGDRVWYDQNLDGIQNAGEPGVPGVEVHLREAGHTAIVATAYTDGNGDYILGGVLCGGYQIDIVPPPTYALTIPNAPGSDNTNDSNPNPSNVTPPDNGADLTVDFGLVHMQDLCPPPGTVGLPSPVGTLFWGVDGGGNVTVRYEQDRGVNDNSYGTNIVQWPRSHSFGDLAGSDKAQFVFKNGMETTVLDFALDYISAAAGTPSGYRSLGAMGGDGRMNAGNSAWILSWDTSLARNLNDTGYCVAGNCSAGGTNLLVNSPPTVSASDYMLPVGTPYGLWNFTNAYYMRISAAAFGASGFGSVSVGLVHDSPPKIGTNAIVPVICEPGGGEGCNLLSGLVSTKDRQLRWELTNKGASKVTLSEVTIVWPAVNGKLSKVKFDADVVWDGRIAWTAGGVTLSGSQLTADSKRKSIGPGRRRIVVFEFEKKASHDLSQYSVSLSFGSGCDLTMSPPPLTAANFCGTAPGTGKPKTLTMVYTDANGAAPGSNCTMSCNQQDPAKVIVSGDPSNASPVYIIATPTGKTPQLFAGSVLLDGQFVLSAASAGLATLDTNTTVVFYANLGGTRLSSVQFHTSCSQPLVDGDYYGSLQLIDFSR
jgi:hypothetical protein